MKTIVVDVDLTLVDTLTPWVEWWEFMTDSKFDWDNINKDYSINDQLKTKMTREEYMEYWRKADLYDDLEPLPGAKETLKWYSAMGCEIYFVSKCEQGHVKSKQRFLDKHFPFHDGLINTKYKHMIEADIYFEDHVPYIKEIRKHRPHSQVYQFVTRDNSYQLVDGTRAMKSWENHFELH